MSRIKGIFWLLSILQVKFLKSQVMDFPSTPIIRVESFCAIQAFSMVKDSGISNVVQFKGIFIAFHLGSAIIVLTRFKDLLNLLGLVKSTSLQPEKSISSRLFPLLIVISEYPALNADSIIPKFSPYSFHTSSWFLLAQ